MAIRYVNLSSTVIQNILDNEPACHGMVLLRLITAVNFAWRLSQVESCRTTSAEDYLLNFIDGEDFGLTNFDFMLKDPRQEWQLTKNLDRVAGTMDNFVKARLANAEPPINVEDLPRDYRQQALIHVDSLDRFFKLNDHPVLLVGIVQGYCNRSVVQFVDNKAEFIEDFVSKTLYLNECSKKRVKVWDDIQGIWVFRDQTLWRSEFMISPERFSTIPHQEENPTLLERAGAPQISPFSQLGTRNMIYGLLKHGIRLYKGVSSPFPAVTKLNNDYFTYTILSTEIVEDTDIVVKDIDRAISRVIITYEWTLNPEHAGLADGLGFWETTGEITSQDYTLSNLRETKSTTTVDVTLTGIAMYGPIRPDGTRQSYPDDPTATKILVDIPHYNYLTAIDSLDFDFNSTIK